MKVLANATVVIVLQNINVANQHAVHLNLHNIMCQLYPNKAGKMQNKTKNQNQTRQTKALRYNSHTIKLTLLKYTIPGILGGGGA